VLESRPCSALHGATAASISSWGSGCRGCRGARERRGGQGPSAMHSVRSGQRANPLRSCQARAPPHLVRRRVKSAGIPAGRRAGAQCMRARWVLRRPHVSPAQAGRRPTDTRVTQRPGSAAVYSLQPSK
jgi:hypothetical protein